MSGSSGTLHGSAPDSCPVALLLVDVINPLDFPEGDQLLRYAVPAAECLAALKGRARAAGVPVIYANDYFGRWRSDLSAVVADGVASNTAEDRDAALALMRRVLKARTPAGAETDFAALLSAAASPNVG